MGIAARPAFSRLHGANRHPRPGRAGGLLLIAVPAARHETGNVPILQLLLKGEQTHYSHHCFRGRDACAGDPQPLVRPTPPRLCSPCKPLPNAPTPRPYPSSGTDLSASLCMGRPTSTSTRGEQLRLASHPTGPYSSPLRICGHGFERVRVIQHLGVDGKTHHHIQVHFTPHPTGRRLSPLFISGHGFERVLVIQHVVVDGQAHHPVDAPKG